MTCVAWDGKTLAADKRAVIAGNKNSVVTKIFRWSGGLCAIAGEYDSGMQMYHWLNNGAHPEDFPIMQNEDPGEFMVIYKDGSISHYERSPVALPFENQIHALGSGRDYALGAMHLGASAKAAVEVAIALDCYCGNGIDTLELVT